MYEEALAIDSHCASAHGALGDLLWSLNRRAESIAHYERAVAVGQGDAEWHGGLGRAYLDIGDCSRALELFAQGSKLNPLRADLRVGLGESLLRLGKLEAALDAFLAAETLEPYNLDACRRAVSLLELLGRRRDVVGAWCGLGAALERSLDFAESTNAYREALRRKPDCLPALVGVGRGLLWSARPNEAIEAFEATLDRAPQQVEARQSLGWARALTGDLVSNWDAIGHHDRGEVQGRFEQPLWDGGPLDGQTILLWANAGVGDALQLLRFIEPVKRMRARIIVECHGPLVPLVARMPGVDRVVAQGAPLPSFDVHALFTSLPRLFRTGWDEIPGDVPYLSADRALAAVWRRRLASLRGRRIGLAWRGGPHGTMARLRFLPLAAFAPFATLRKSWFVGLQSDVQTIERLVPPTGLAVEHFLDESNSLEDVAALIVNLDLIISVDAMIAHLAGGLGRPVWTLLPHAPDWRWRSEGDASPWYPTMSLFRQAGDGRWFGVLDRVREALDSW